MADTVRRIDVNSDLGESFGAYTMGALAGAEMGMASYSPMRRRALPREMRSLPTSSRSGCASITRTG